VMSSSRNARLPRRKLSAGGSACGEVDEGEMPIRMTKPIPSCRRGVSPQCTTRCDHSSATLRRL
jgi:hypothetical protein